MKKLITTALALAMMASLAACGAGTTESQTQSEAVKESGASEQKTEKQPNETTEEGKKEAKEESGEKVTADANMVDPGKWNWPDKKEDLNVGFSQADLASTWRTVESDHMQQIADERGYKLSITNAEGDTEQQISDVESLIAQGCNVMVIVPIDADAIQPALDACNDKGIPVIIKARGANAEAGVDYVASVMSDFVWQGYNAGTWIESKLKDRKEPINVVEIQGVIGGTDVRDRSQGFHNAAEEFGNMEFIAQQSANWSRSEAQEVTQNILQSQGDKVDVIFCHNDEMALGASLAVQAAGYEINKDIYICGIDGMKEALQAVRNDKLSVSVTCTPKYADTVFDVIEQCIEGKQVPASIAVNDAVVDKANVDQYYELGF